MESEAKRAASSTSTERPSHILRFSHSSPDPPSSTWWNKSWQFSLCNYRCQDDSRMPEILNLDLVFCLEQHSAKQAASWHLVEAALVCDSFSTVWSRLHFRIQGHFYCYFDLPSNASHQATVPKTSSLARSSISQM